MGNLSKPNVTYPLVASYNPRGTVGDTNTRAGLDQRKINSFYEPVKNTGSGMQTVYLSKRPAVTPQSPFGVSSQTAFLISLGAGNFGNDATASWVYSTSGNDVRASDNTTTITLQSVANYQPAFVDKTAISGVDTVVLQVYNASTNDQRVYYSSSLPTWTEISSATFTTRAHIGKMEYMDGYAFVADVSTSRIYASDLNTLDVWQPLSFVTKQIRQDALRGLAKLGKRIVAFGVQSAEVFANAGTEVGNPLVSIPDLAGNIGLTLSQNQEIGVSYFTGFTNYYTVLQNKMYFIGRPSLQGSALYSFDGSQFNKISRGPLDKIITEVAGAGIFSVNKIVFGGKDAVAIQLTHASTVPQRWLMYYPEWDDWFEWNSTVFSPVNSNGMRFLGVSSNANKVYGLQHSAEVYADDGVPYQWLHQFQMPKDGNTFHKMDMCQLIGDTARSTSSFSINVSFSDNDGQTFTSTRPIDMTTNEKMITRCGSYATRLVRLDYTGTETLRLEKFAARITK